MPDAGPSQLSALGGGDSAAEIGGVSKGCASNGDASKGGACIGKSTGSEKFRGGRVSTAGWKKSGVLCDSEFAAATRGAASIEGGGVDEVVGSARKLGGEELPRKLGGAELPPPPKDDSIAPTKGTPSTSPRMPERPESAA